MSEKSMDRVSLLRDIRSRKPDASFGEIAPACKPESHSSLVELACIDLIDRLRAGAVVRVEEYVGAVTELSGADDVLDLIDAEICVRQELGEPADRDELVARFPALASAIDRMFFLDQIENELQPPARKREQLPTVDGYVLTKRIVTDSCSSTFRAQKADTEVRLVRLFADGSRDDVQLIAGIKAATGLDHPALLRIGDTGATAEGFFYEMPFVDGTPLRSLIERPVEPKKAAGWLRGLAIVWAFADSQNVSLGAVRVGQVLIDHRDQAVVLGFGEAIAEGESEPVQLFGQVMFEVLTGTRFEQSEPAKALLARQSDAILRQMCGRCLGLAGETRYGDLADVLDDLTDYLAGRATVRKSANFLSKLWRKK